MTNVSGLTRGDKNRNRRLARLRGLVRSDYAIVALDLGEDTHMAGVYDHETRAVARRKLTTTKAFELGEVLDWAAAAAGRAGFAGITVSCEPTGSRWMQVGQLAAARGVPMVCVQPLATHRAREEDDYTLDKSDYRDTTLIAAVTARLQCYVPEAADEQWARLRHQGHRRAQLTERAQAAVLQAGDLLGLAWPAVLDAAATTFDAVNWVASVAVVTDRCDGDPAKVKKMGRARFTQAVRRELPRWGGKNVYRRIIDAVYDALTDTHGAVIAQRKGALQRAGWAIDDLRSARGQLAAVDTAMITQLDTLGIADLLATIPGLSAATAAHILAETGDPARFATARSMVKHAGLNPCENTSGRFKGQTRISKRGRPRLRLAAWRAAWSLVQHNPVAAARHAHLTSRDTNPLTDTQARVAVAAATLRWIHAVITTRLAWDPTIAAGNWEAETIAA